MAQAQTIIKNAVINESANDYSLPTVRGTNGQFLQTDGSGVASWATLTASNGLTKTGIDIELGGTLTENTAISQAGFNMIYNLTGAGDFAVQDNGTDVFKVSGDGSVTFNNGTDAFTLPTNDGSINQYLHTDGSGVNKLEDYRSGRDNIKWYVEWRNNWNSLRWYGNI